jgi:hypothetical protein
MREDYHFLKRCFDELEKGQSDGLGGAGEDGVDLDMDGIMSSPALRNIPQANAKTSSVHKPPYTRCRDRADYRA